MASASLTSSSGPFPPLTMMVAGGSCASATSAPLSRREASSGDLRPHEARSEDDDVVGARSRRNLPVGKSSTEKDEKAERDIQGEAQNVGGDRGQYVVPPRVIDSESTYGNHHHRQGDHRQTGKEGQQVSEATAFAAHHHQAVHQQEDRQDRVCQEQPETGVLRSVTSR